MNDPQSSPGIRFPSFRVVNLEYDLPTPATDGADGRLSLRYDDEVRIDGRNILLRQDVIAEIVGGAEGEVVYLHARAQLEGLFVADEDPNLDLLDFANNHAPAILFAFTREWIHKITSAADPWPAILIPPTNVLAMRKQAKGELTPKGD